MSSTAVHVLTVLAALALTITTLVVTSYTSSPASASPASPTAAPDDETNQNPVFLDITSISPNTVTTSSPNTVTVTGVIVNRAPTAFSNITARVQRAPAASSSRALRTGLIADPSEFPVVSSPSTVHGKLVPGSRLAFTLTVPLSTGGLEISTPGVYPLLVSVTGTPADGSASTLDNARTLLPVIGLPPNPTRAATASTWADSASSDPDQVVAGPDGSIAPSVASPTPLTMLWPLASKPTMAPGIPSAPEISPRLMNEDLLHEISGGGRLDVLLSAASNTLSDPSTPLAHSICLAIDPDLLITLRAMTAGYVVTDNPSDPTSRTHPGAGSEQAKDWLARLRAVADKSCVIALPDAQASLDAVARTGVGSLAAATVAGGAALVDNMLGVHSVRGVTIPSSGVLNTNAAQMVTATLGSSTAGAVLSESAVNATDSADPRGLYRTGELPVQVYDPAVTAALAALGSTPSVPAITPDADRVSPAAESITSRRQTALASLTYAALTPSMPSRPGGGLLGRSSFVMPPTVWSPGPDDVTAVVNAMEALLDSRLAVPRRMDSVAADLKRAQSDQPIPNAQLSVPDGTSVDGTVISNQIVDRVRTIAVSVDRLQGALVDRPNGSLTPQTFMAPLHESLIRALRATPQGTPDRPAAEAASRVQVAGTATAMRTMRAGVSILDPGGQFTLASERSPLLLVIRNEMPMAIRTKLSAQMPTGIQVDDMGAVEVPSRGTRQLQLPARAPSSRNVSIKFTLLTVTGMPVGEPVSLSVHSNAYGKSLFYITLAAAALLIILAGRRLWRRFRGRPDPADVDRPEPDEHERILADSWYLHSSEPREPDARDTRDRNLR